jgi:hypothetical protein
MSDRFLFDNNLSPRLAEGMKAFGEDVDHMQKAFPAPFNVDDTLLVQGAKEKGFNFVITRDLHIRRRFLERNAVKIHGIGLFALGGKDRTAWQLIEQTVRNWRQIKEIAADTGRPFAFIVRPKGGVIERLPL